MSQSVGPQRSLRFGQTGRVTRKGRQRTVVVLGAIRASASDSERCDLSESVDWREAEDCGPETARPSAWKPGTIRLWIRPAVPALEGSVAVRASVGQVLVSEAESALPRPVGRADKDPLAGTQLQAQRHVDKPHPVPDNRALKAVPAVLGPGTSAASPGRPAASGEQRLQSRRQPLRSSGRRHP